MANRENIAKWVAALRSGEYEQGRAALRRGNDFCCLGVACDISGVGEWEDMRTGVGMFFYRTEKGSRIGNSATLPAAVSRWLGIDTDNPKLKYGLTGPSSLPASVLNDSHKLPFSEIADLIEAAYLADEVVEPQLIGI